MAYIKGKKNRARHWLKIGAWIVGVAMLLFVSLFFFTSWLQNKIEQTVLNQSKGVYKLHLFGLQISPLVGGIAADSLSLVPNYERWKELHSQQKQVPRMVLDLQTNKFKLSGLNLISILMGQNVSVDRLEMQQPILLMTVMREDTTQQHKPLYKTVKGFMKGLQVEKIDVNAAKLQYRKSVESEKYLFRINSFNLTIDDFQLDSQSFQAKDRAYYANKVEFAASGAQYFTPDGTYGIGTDSIYINTETRNLLAKQVKLKPTSDPAGLARAKGRAVSYTELEIPEVNFKNLNYPHHSRNNNFIGQHLLIASPELQIFKDKKNFDSKGKRQPLPHEIVQQMQIKFLLDSVELSNGSIKYAEIVPQATERGNISLQEISISMRNVSNMPEHMSDQKPAIGRFSGLVMGKVPVKMSVYMPLLNENGYHRIEGEISSGNPEVLNPIIVPTAFVRVQSGYINRGTFNVELTNNTATGTLHLLYNNLKIDLLSKGTGGEQSLGKEIISKLANVVVIKNSNPDDKGEEPRVGEINVTRNSEKTVFNYWKDCLMDGFLSIVGAGAKAKKL